MTTAAAWPTSDSPASHQISQHTVETSGGRRYRLYRAVPSCPNPAGHPSLYLLDGNAAFAGLTPFLLARVPDLLVVGLGYDTDGLFDYARRRCDYTPPRDGRGPALDPQRPEYMAGGAATFQQDLLGELRTAAERDVPIDPSGRSLWGHSFGGLFVLYTLFTRPEAFQSYLPVSPSLWWGDDVMVTLERAAATRSRAPASVHVMLGDRESRSDRPKPANPGPAPATLALASRLQRRSDLDVTTRILTGCGHRDALDHSLPLALQHAGGSHTSSGEQASSC
ncbi:alpha/beta hydrolase [Rhodovibrio salinarum]|uniref:Alpha/beta hydrolase n=1 Tax=Rhodovibrio salinarum TaxID=1087 RepID=A0A934QJ39_9PROT|nr:alpha/beta hydrolase-fold protein [Rhodovibrio salinarum]MBK1697779.1 hypothetical protein [Rhodovibrio salinarum]